MEFNLLSVKRAVPLSVLVAACLGACASGSAPEPSAPPRTAPVAAASSSARGPSPPADAAPSLDAPARPTRSVRADAGREPATAPPPAPTIPEGTTVLHVGDSMAGALGIELNRALREAGVHSILRFKTASFIPNWASGPEIPIYMQRYNPDLTLISLGANEVQIEDPTIRINAIRKLVGRLGGRPCVWIAPPLWKAGDTGLLPIIRENCAPCRFMDTNALVKNMPRVSDKIHPTMAARKVWAKFVVGWLVRQRDTRAGQPWALLPASAVRSPGPTLDFATLESEPPTR